MTSTDTVGGDERLRLFLALQLPEHAARALAEWAAQRLVGSGRRLPVEHLHVTLAFLGSTPPEQLEPIAEALRRAAAVGRRPLLVPERYRETRSVGMLVFRDEGGHATAFAEDVHARLEAIGVYERERRPWLPHVTVLRFKEKPGFAPPAPELGSIAPSDAAVYLSRLHPSGARYEVLESMSLGGDR